MLVSMIKTFNEDHRAGCEDVELAPLQYTTYELQPLGQSQQVLVLQCLFASRCSGFQLKACTFSHSWPSSRTNRQRMLVVTTLAPPTTGERVARTNKQRTLFVTTLAPPTAGERVARRNRQRMLVVTTLASPTAGERVAWTNRQRMLVVTTLAPPTAGERVAWTNRQRMLLVTTLVH